MYEYKTRFLPSNITVRKGNLGTVTPQIEQFLQSECIQGWEYYRSDALNLIEQSGCLGGIFGAASTVIPVVLFIFRRDTSVDKSVGAAKSIDLPTTLTAEIAWMEKSGIRLGTVLSKDDRYAYVKKDNGENDKFLLSTLKFTLE